MPAGGSLPRNTRGRPGRCGGQRGPSPPAFACFASRTHHPPAPPLTFGGSPRPEPARPAGRHRHPPPLGAPCSRRPLGSPAAGVRGAGPVRPGSARRRVAAPRRPARGQRRTPWPRRERGPSPSEGAAEDGGRAVRSAPPAPGSVPAASVSSPPRRLFPHPPAPPPPPRGGERQRLPWLSRTRVLSLGRSPGRWPGPRPG